jgi:hypothetical protein
MTLNEIGVNNYQAIGLIYLSSRIGFSSMPREAVTGVPRRSLASMGKAAACLPSLTKAEANILIATTMPYPLRQFI